MNFARQIENALVRLNAASRNLNDGTVAALQSLGIDDPTEGKLRIQAEPTGEKPMSVPLLRYILGEIESARRDLDEANERLLTLTNETAR